MRVRRGWLICGIMVFLVGALVSVSSLGYINLTPAMILPILVLGLALLFHLLYFAMGANEPGLLVPGGILLVYGLWMLAPAIDQRFLLFFELWPLALIGPALGIFELYVFSRGRYGSMKAVFILTVIGGIFLLRQFMDMSLWLLFGLFLVVGGFFIILNSLGHHKRSKEELKYKQNPTAAAPSFSAPPAQPVEPVVQVREEEATQPAVEKTEEPIINQPEEKPADEPKIEE